MNDTQNTTPESAETTTEVVISNQTMTDILQSYKSKSVRLPIDRINPRSVDKYPDHELGNYQVYTPEAAKPDITSVEFLEYLRKAFLVYKKNQNIQELYFHPENVKTITRIAEYITNADTNTINPNKGLYIFGTFGNGKTDFTLILTQTINVLAPKYRNLSKYHIMSYNAIYEGIRDTGSIDKANDIKRAVYLDDFLYQDRNTARVYGNTDNVADIVTSRLYDLHKAGHRHIMTSNVPPDKIPLHPGSIDRINEMFNFIFWEGKSLRK
jgi:hypothetical protein